MLFGRRRRRMTMAEHGFDDREVLEIFVESVDELLGSDFLAQVKADGISNQLKWSHDTEFLSERTGPKRDAVKAFLLTLRFFQQNNEATSLCNMEDRINGLDIDAALKERFRTSRHNFNSYLDKPPSVSFPNGSGVDNRRRILEAFLYGIFAHANPKHRRRVKTWEGEPYFDDIRSQFDLILLDYLKAVSAMANVCRECLKAGIA
jgi:hypothetical protein